MGSDCPRPHRKIDNTIPSVYTAVLKLVLPVWFIVAHRDPYLGGSFRSKVENSLYLNFCVEQSLYIGFTELLWLNLSKKPSATS